jgi:hypothetical protein
MPRRPHKAEGTPTLTLDTQSTTRSRTGRGPPGPSWAQIEPAQPRRRQPTAPPPPQPQRPAAAPRPPPSWGRHPSIRAHPRESLKEALPVIGDRGPRAAPAHQISRKPGTCRRFRLPENPPPRVAAVGAKTSGAAASASAHPLARERRQTKKKAPPPSVVGPAATASGTCGSGGEEARWGRPKRRRLGFCPAAALGRATRSLCFKIKISI